MLVIVGFVVVLGAVLGGFVMAGGALGVLIQPSEFVVIGGAGLGSLLVSTPGPVIAGIAGQLKGALTGAGATKNDYVDLLSLLFQIFKVVQQQGAMGLEAHFEDPAKSTILSRYPKFLGRHHAVDFLADRDAARNPRRQNAAQEPRRCRFDVLREAARDARKPALAIHDQGRAAREPLANAGKRLKADSLRVIGRGETFNSCVHDHLPFGCQRRPHLPPRDATLPGQAGWREPSSTQDAMSFRA